MEVAPAEPLPALQLAVSEARTDDDRRESADMGQESSPSCQIVDFKFTSEEEPYGFVNIGSRVCEVVPGTLAENYGVRSGWYIAIVAGEKLHGATVNLRRTVPAVTTDEVRDCLRRRRAEAMKRDCSVRVIFWISPTMIERPVVQEGFCADSIREFKRVLVQKYGSLVAAWREALDKDGSGSLDYQEFLLACREVGFEGSLKQAYNEMDKDGSGLISLRELDPTCEMDFTIGRCCVCKLPNPCEKHTNEDQKAFTLKLRHKELTEDATCDVYDVEVG